MNEHMRATSALACDRRPNLTFFRLRTDHNNIGIPRATRPRTQGAVLCIYYSKIYDSTSRRSILITSIQAGSGGVETPRFRFLGSDRFFNSRMWSVVERHACIWCWKELLCDTVCDEAWVKAQRGADEQTRSTSVLACDPMPNMTCVHHTSGS